MKTKATAVGNPVRRVAVIGAGTLGSSWTTLLLASGFEVIAADVDRAAEAKLRRYVDTAWQVLAGPGVSARGSPEHLSFTTDATAAAASADFVQECVPEDLNLKTRVICALDARVPREVIIASSTATLSITELQAACSHPERCVVGHPFYPPHIMPLVEVVGGAKTSPKTIERSMAFYVSAGRKPIHIRREVMGHVASRLQAALYREVAYLIDTGVVGVAEMDATAYCGLGLAWAAMGPSMLLHLSCGPTGIPNSMENGAKLMSDLWTDLGSPELTPELRETIINGVLKEVGDRSLTELSQERDELVLRLLRSRARASKFRRRAKSR
jgi:carnitine 3-dehydrogenase